MDIQALELIYSYSTPNNLGIIEPTEVIDLLGGVIQLAVEGAVSGWTPAYAALKNSGIWNDSPLLDGRQLTAAASGNVTETMSCVATGTHAARASAIARLMRFAQAARDFHTEDAAYRPVYIRYWAVGAPAEQYALVYNIDVDVQQDPFGAADSNPVTLTIEREPFWRAVAPFVNPNQYTKQVTGVATALVSASVSNFHEINTIHALQRQNFIDIPASMVAGDAPALCKIDIDPPTPSPAAWVKRVWVARSTTPLRFVSQADDWGNTVRAIDCAISPFGTAVITAQSDGLVQRNHADPNRYVVRFTMPATHTTLKYVTVELQEFKLQKSLVFVRGKLVSGSYSTLKTEVHLQYGDDTYLAKLPFVLGSNFTTAYAGIFDPPAMKQMIVGGKAWPPLVTLDFYAATTGGAATFDLWDVVFIPFDECALMIEGITGGYTTVLDASGFKSGSGDAAFTADVTTPTSRQKPLIPRGQPIVLEPNQHNRLYFMFEYDPATAAPLQTYATRVDIVPRWHGVRDG